MIITVTDIIISETGKKINDVISHQEIKHVIKKSDLKDFKKYIKRNNMLSDKHDIIVSLIYKEN